LLTEESYRVAMGVGQSHGSSAFFSKKTEKKKFTGACHNCGKKGHQKRDCWAKGGGKEGQGPRQRRAEEPEANHVGVRFSLSVSRRNEEHRDMEWILDSGASDHMTGHSSSFTSMKRINSEEHVSLADKTKLKIEGIGSIELIAMVDGKAKSIEIKNVLYIPRIKKNLISIKRLTEKGCRVEFDSKGALITYAGQTVAMGELHSGNVYKLAQGSRELHANLAVKSNFGLWHRRLGHLNTSQMYNVPQAAEGVELKGTPSECKTCNMNKITRQSFKKKTKEESPKKIGWRIYADLGEAPVRSINGEKYYATYTDSTSGACVVYLLKKKSEQFQSFQNFVEKLKNLGHRIVSLRCDNGG
jgi:hypothetical protein